MKLVTYTLDTKGGTDWTTTHTVLAQTREEADEFMLPKVKDGYFDTYVVVLHVKETDLPKSPCFWYNPEARHY